MRDIFGLRSVHGAEELAADAGLASLAVDHHSLARGEDRDAQPAEDARDLVLPHVPAPSGTRNAPQAPDHRLPLVVLQEDGDLALLSVLVDEVVLDVALALEDVDDRQLQLAGRDHRLLVPRHARIANAGQHVGDRIGYVGHRNFPISMGPAPPRRTMRWSGRGPRTPPLPGGLGHTRDLAAERPHPEADPAHLELPEEGTRPPAERAAVVLPD